MSVDQVFAFPRPEQPPRNGHLAPPRRLAFLHRLEFVAIVVHLGIHQGHRDRRHAHRLSIARAAEDHVFHPGAAQAFGRLFAQDPADGVADVRLAAAVGPDNRRDAVAVEAQLRAVAKGLKALKFYAFESQQSVTSLASGGS